MTYPNKNGLTQGPIADIRRARDDNNPLSSVDTAHKLAR